MYRQDSVMGPNDNNRRKMDDSKNDEKSLASSMEPHEDDDLFVEVVWSETQFPKEDARLLSSL